MNALLELREDLLDVLLVREAVDDLKLGELDVNRVVVLAEKDLDVVPKDHGPALDDEEDVAQGDVLDLVPRGEKSDCAFGRQLRGCARERKKTHREEEKASGTWPRRSPDFPCSS